MAEEDLRVIAVAMAALATTWPAKKSYRSILFAVSGLLIVMSSWSATFVDRHLDWAIGAVLIMSVGVGGAVEEMYKVFTTPMYTWVLFAACLGAVHVCVPENDQTNDIALLFAAAGISELLLRRRLPASVWAAAVTAILWSAVYGSSGQGRAIVGGLFALLPIFAVSGFVRLSERRSAPTENSRWLVISIWVVAAWTVARTGGIAQTTAAAWVAALIAVPIALALSFWVWRYQRVVVH